MQNTPSFNPKPQTPIRAQPSLLNMVAGPVLAGVIVGTVVTLGISSAAGGEEFMKTGYPFAIFPFPFALVTVAALYFNWNYSRWETDGTCVRRGGEPLFRISEIEAVQLGIPDNWITRLASIPGIEWTKLRTLKAASERQKEMLVVRLSRNRWFIWSGSTYENGRLFRDYLQKVAPVKEIAEIPPEVAKKLGPTSIHKVIEV